MAPDSTYGGRIVRSWPGRGTLDTYYETEDGTTWYSSPAMNYDNPTVTTCGPRRGEIINGCIVPRR